MTPEQSSPNVKNDNIGAISKTRAYFYGADQSENRIYQAVAAKSLNEKSGLCIPLTIISLGVIYSHWYRQPHD